MILSGIRHYGVLMALMLSLLGGVEQEDECKARFEHVLLIIYLGGNQQMLTESGLAFLRGIYEPYGFKHIVFYADGTHYDPRSLLVPKKLTKDEVPEGVVFLDSFCADEKSTVHLHLCAVANESYVIPPFAWAQHNVTFLPHLGGGFLVQKALADAILKHPGFEGYLYVPDDAFVRWWLLSEPPYSADSIWLPANKPPCNENISVTVTSCEEEESQKHAMDNWTSYLGAVGRNPVSYGAQSPKMCYATVNADLLYVGAPYARRTAELAIESARFEVHFMGFFCSLPALLSAPPNGMQVNVQRLVSYYNSANDFNASHSILHPVKYSLEINKKRATAETHMHSVCDESIAALKLQASSTQEVHWKISAMIIVGLLCICALIMWRCSVAEPASREFFASPSTSDDEKSGLPLGR